MDLVGEGNIILFGHKLCFSDTESPLRGSQHDNAPGCHPDDLERSERVSGSIIRKRDV